MSILYHSKCSIICEHYIYKYEVDEFVREVLVRSAAQLLLPVLASSALVLALSLATALRSHTAQIPDFTIAVPSTHLDNSTIANMSAAINKIAANSPSRASPSEIETSIANVSHSALVVASNRSDFIKNHCSAFANDLQALFDLESNIPDMKAALRPLQFVSAREVR